MKTVGKWSHVSHGSELAKEVEEASTSSMCAANILHCAECPLPSRHMVQLPECREGTGCPHSEVSLCTL